MWLDDFPSHTLQTASKQRPCTLNPRGYPRALVQGAFRSLGSYITGQPWFLEWSAKCQGIRGPFYTVYPHMSSYMCPCSCFLLPSLPWPPRSRQNNFACHVHFAVSTRELPPFLSPLSQPHQCGRWHGVKESSRVASGVKGWKGSLGSSSPTYSHFTDKRTEAQRGKATYPHSSLPGIVVYLEQIKCLT